MFNAAKVSNSKITTSLDAGKIVICNVRNGTHWVIATSYTIDSIVVNDPGYNVATYALSEIVDGQNVVYRVTKDAIVGRLI